MAPDGQKKHKGYAMCLLFLGSGFGNIALGILDWRTLTLPSNLRRGVGVPVYVLGMGLSTWAFHALGANRSFGSTKGIKTDGPYRWMRNPQYAGFMLSLAVGRWSRVRSAP